MAKKNKIEIVIEGKNKTGKAIGDAEENLSKLEKAAKGTEGGLSKMDVAVGNFAATVASEIAGMAIGAVVDLGKAVLDVNRDFQDSGAKITAALGATSEEAKALKGTVTDLFAKGFDVSSATDALVSVRQNMGDLAGRELKDVTQGVLTISKMFEQDIGKSANAAGALMKQFGLNSQQAMDFIATGFQSGLNTSDDFLDSIGEYSNQFASLGFSADEFFSIMQSGLQSGVLGTDKIADAIKEFGVRMQDGSDTTRDALNALFAEVNGGVNEVERLNSEIANAEQAFKAAGDNVEYWEAKLAASKEEADMLSSAIDETKRALDDLSRPNLAGMDEFDDKLFDLDMKAKELKLSMIGMDEESPEFANTKAALDSVNTEIEKLTLQRDIKFEPQLRAIAEAADYAQEPVLTFNQAMGQIGQQQTNLTVLQQEFANATQTVATSEQELTKWQSAVEASKSRVEMLKNEMSNMSGPAQEMLQAISDGNMSVADSLPQIIEMLRQVKDPIEQNRIGVALFGTQWEDMTAKGILAIDTTMAKVGEMGGAMGNMTAAAQTTGQEATGAWNQILLALQPLAQVWDDFLRSDILPLVKEYAPQLAKWLKENLPAGIAALKTGIQFIQPLFALFNGTLERTSMIASVVEGAISAFLGIFVNLSAAFQGVISPMQAAKNMFNDFLEPIKGGINVLKSLIKEVLSLGSAFDKASNSASRSGGGSRSRSISGEKPKRYAAGGDFAAGKPMIVGEQGPEMILPSRSGTVVPNNALASAGGVTMNATINITGGADQSVVAQVEDALNRVVDNMIQRRK